MDGSEFTIEQLIGGLEAEIIRRHTQCLKVLRELRTNVQAAGALSDPILHSTPNEFHLLIQALNLQLASSALPSSHRKMVADATRDDYLSVRQISKATGLTEKQVRGVLYDPKLVQNQRIQKSRTYGETRFKVKSPNVPS